LSEEDEDLLDMTEDVEYLDEDELVDMPDSMSDDELLKMSETSEISVDDIGDLAHKTVINADVESEKTEETITGEDSAGGDLFDLTDKRLFDGEPVEPLPAGGEGKRDIGEVVEEELDPVQDDAIVDQAQVPVEADEEETRIKAPADEELLELSDTIEIEDILGSDREGDIPRKEKKTAPVSVSEDSKVINGEFVDSLDTELETALDISDSESEIKKILDTGRVSARVHNRQEIDIPSDFESETIHAWHEGVRKKIYEAGSGLVSEEQLESALVRVIKETYAEKLEKMIEETVEKTIRQEIDKLSKLLSGGD